MITHDYISTVQFFNSVVIVVIIYVVIRIYTKMFRLNFLPVTLTLYPIFSNAVAICSVDFQPKDS